MATCFSRLAPRPALLLVAALLLSALIWPPAARAAAFTVTRTDDPPPSGCAPADCSLREAIIAANAASGPDTIILPAGAYALALAGTGEDAGATGDLDIGGDTTLIGANAATTKIDGNQLDRVLDIHSGNVIVSGVTLWRGRAETTGDGGGIRNAGALAIASSAVISNTSGVQMEGANGGGIFSTGPLRVADSTIRWNEAGQRGGGIAARGPTTLTNTAVSDNYGWGAVGGIESTAALTMTGSTVSGNGSGEGSEGGIGNSGRMIIRRSVITGNNASDGSGGGIYNTTRGVLEIGESEISYNQGSGLDGGGGGILNMGTLTVTASLISHNTIGAWSGAGLANQGAATIVGSTIEANSTGEDGGGIGNSGTLTLLGSTVDQNHAGTNGGGIANTGVLSATNSTISANGAAGAGSGVYNAGDLALESATIALNGHGLVTLGSVKIHNSILAGNADADCEGAIESQGYNLFGSLATCSGAVAPGDLFGYGGQPLDPKLGALASNGGPTRTHMPLAGSPAIDHGDPASCPAADQRGIPRPYGAACDIGAAERAWRALLPLVDR